MFQFRITKNYVKVQDLHLQRAALHRAVQVPGGLGVVGVAVRVPGGVQPDGIVLGHTDDVLFLRAIDL